MLNSAHSRLQPPRRFAVAVIVVVAAASMGLVPTSKPVKPTMPVTVQFVGAKPGVIDREPASGWPIALRLTSNGELGIGRPTIPPAFPRFRELGYLVFADPDGCFSFGLGNSCATTDETYIEF